MTVWTYVRSYRSSLHYWRFEQALWIASIPVFKYMGWLSNTELISMLSVYALYQNATQRIDQIRAKAKESFRLKHTSGKVGNRGPDPRA